MADCLSYAFIGLQDRKSTQSFQKAGLESSQTNLGNGTTIHCWVPKAYKPNKPNLVLLHGLGASAIRQWFDYVLVLSTEFNVYAPDLVFFGKSYTDLPERSDAFQAQCVMRTLEAHGVRQMQIVGMSYGGFVGYCMAARFPKVVERLVLVASAVAMEENDLEKGMFLVKNIDEATSILLPQTPEKVMHLLRHTCYTPPKMYFPCFVNIIIELMCSEFRQERKELIETLFLGRKLSELPKINQPTLLIWGDSDQMFPPELAYRLKRRSAANALREEHNMLPWLYINSTTTGINLRNFSAKGEFVSTEQVKFFFIGKIKNEGSPKMKINGLATKAELIS